MNSKSPMFKTNFSKNLTKDNFDLIILTSSENIKNNNLVYLLKQDFDQVFSIITKDRVYAYISPLEYINLKKEIKKSNKDSIKKSVITYKEFNYKTIKNDISIICQDIKRKKKSYKATGLTVGLDYKTTSIQSKKNIKKLFDTIKIKFFDSSGIFEDLRLIKTEYEIESITKACKISEDILKKITKKLSQKQFKTEKSILNFIKQETIKKNSSLSFEPIVASGTNTNKPHHIAQDQKLKKGFLMLDFGNTFQRYCSDITRMFYLGNPSKVELNKYKELLTIQKKLVSLCLPETKIKDLEIKSRDLLGKDATFFVHSLGHGVGLDIHERPFFNEQTKLKEGMIITIEPGLYFENYGMRIEDTVLIGKKPKRLTKSKKDLIIIK